MNRIVSILSILALFSCQGQEAADTLKKEIEMLDSAPSEIEKFYEEHIGNNEPSESKGSVSNGSLVNGKIIPFASSNFQYFDTLSYIGGRAFTNDKVKQTLLDTYAELAIELPNRKFFIMECSNKNGGQIFPHRTHQNGLSIDFMMPLIKNGKPNYELDLLGKDHYWLDFDNEGKYSKDKAIKIDFELVARHILLLEKHARKNGLKISKVIIKTELKDELFASDYGKKLKESGVYVVKKLSQLINLLHDDHYHIDFQTL